MRDSAENVAGHTDAHAPGAPRQGRLVLPEWMDAALTGYKTAEVSTVSRHGAPSTAPLSVIYRPERGRFLTTSAVAFPQKVFNLKRDPTISLLYSYPVGTRFDRHAPVVLVQGVAHVRDDLVTNRPQFEATAPEWVRRQPGFGTIWHSGRWRWLYRYYLIRVFVTITPSRIMGWEQGDLTGVPTVIECEDARPDDAPVTAAPPPRDAGILVLPDAAQSRLRTYAHGVFSVRQPDTGRIFSAPCQCHSTQPDGVVTASVSPGIIVPRPNPYAASLCFHKHDAQLGDVGQQLCLGSATVGADGLVQFQTTWEHGYEQPPGLEGRLLMGITTRLRGRKYFRGGRKFTRDMVPRPKRSL